jgi:TfoX/Sxy family transcriptional regulator of competence genes
VATFKPVPEALAERFGECLPSDELVERRKMFGCPCAFVNGNMFAGLHEDRVVLRLSLGEREQSIQAGTAQPFQVMGRTMREYVVLVQPMKMSASEVAGWIEQSFLFARGLPPKQAKGAPRTKRATPATNRRAPRS